MGNNVVKDVKDAVEDVFGSDSEVFSISFRSPNIVLMIDSNQTMEQELMIKLRNLRQDYLEQITENSVEATEHAVEFNIGGQPFSTQCTEDDEVNIRNICCEWMRLLRKDGWSLMVSTDLSAWVDDDLSTCYYTKPDDPPEINDIVAVGIMSSLKEHTLLVVNADDGLNKILKKAAGKHVDKAEVQHKKAGYKITLKGEPWAKTDGTAGREILLNVFRDMYQQNYKLQATINFAGHADTMFFERSPKDSTAKPQKQSTPFAMVSLHKRNELRLTNVPQTLVDAVIKCIRYNWQLGLKSESTNGSGKNNSSKKSVVNMGKLNPMEMINKDVQTVNVVLELNADPWSCVGEQAAAARLLVVHILQAINRAGWHVEATIDMSRKADDKSAFIITPLQKQIEYDVCALAPVGNSDFQVLHLNQDDLEQLVKMTSKEEMKPYILGQEEIPNGHQWQMYGRPWAPNYVAQRIAARHTVGLLLFKMHDMGWKVLSSAAIAAEYNENEAVDVHTLFMYRKAE